MDELGELHRQRRCLGQHLAQVALRQEAGLAAYIAVQDALRCCCADAKRLQGNTAQHTHHCWCWWILFRLGMAGSGADRSLSTSPQLVLVTSTLSSQAHFSRLLPPALLPAVCRAWRVCTPSALQVAYLS
eukprot:GHRQ01016835.1.p1 GENE.GHRQ01016835.1~~GHRQ01016835.1.p1  ORF type:complete len:130 (+),score=27.35 GHRQ01016835.1:734-1123(+)